ncbi:MAG: 2-C-methyl-D-erythritol 4-phosphate cytidylyltransferase [Erysipelotrichaceae bacterium]|nr:2-C-methyl-D-erythritol 4-phosphate cytidylyltransferase [Erysipelotrichaceae bacterium]
MKYDVIVVAGGKGNRADLGFNKVLFKMANGKSVIENNINIFLNDKDCQKIILVINEEIDFNNNKLILVKGGKERFDSVMNGLNEVSSEYVLIHDGARPFLNVKALEKLKNKLEEKDAVVLGKIASDTIKIINDDKVVETLNRNNIFIAETPQGFKTSLIKECYKNKDDNYYFDDASLAESFNHEVYIVIDEYNNKKLTSKEDFKNI